MKLRIRTDACDVTLDGLSTLAQLHAAGVIAERLVTGLRGDPGHVKSVNLGAALSGRTIGFGFQGTFNAPEDDE